MTLITLVTLYAMVLQVLDGWLTLQILRYGGREANPIVAYILKRLGVTAGLITVKGLTMGVIVLAALLNQFHVTVGIAGVYTLVCAWNIRVLKNL